MISYIPTEKLTLRHQCNVSKRSIIVRNNRGKLSGYQTQETTDIFIIIIITVVFCRSRVTIPPVIIIIMGYSLYDVQQLF